MTSSSKSMWEGGGGGGSCALLCLNANNKKKRKEKIIRLRCHLRRRVRTPGQKTNVPRKMRAKYYGELRHNLQKTFSTMYTELALVDIYPPEQQADTTITRPREVVGPPMKTVARPSLTPRGQASTFTDREGTPNLIVKSIVLNVPRITAFGSVYHTPSCIPYPRSIPPGW